MAILLGPFPRNVFKINPGMILRDASYSEFMRGIQSTFKAFFMIFKSVILSPPWFFSLMIFNFLISAGIPFQMKLKIIELISLISRLGITSTDAL